MRQTILNILIGRNDIVWHDGDWYQVAEAHIQPCPIYPKLLVIADTWPHHTQRVAFDLDATGYTARQAA